MNRIIKNIILDIASMYYVPQKIFVKPYSKIFLLSHMRSGSSLLTHLLISNPEISGYGECHVIYRRKWDFNRTLSKIQLTNRKLFLSRHNRFVLDKVLHNEYLSNQATRLIRKPDSFIIFLIREPSEALPSLMEHSPKGLYEFQAAGYYIRRLERLEGYARKIRYDKVPIAVTYDQILFNTQEVFKLIQEYLQLGYDLKENYNITGTTGIIGKGDSSANIKRGRICRYIQHKRDFHISDELHRKANDAYEKCKDTLFAVCKTVD